MPETPEIEIKLDVDPADLAAVRARLDGLFGTPRDTRQLVSVYFDTADHVLRKAGLALRIRHAGVGRVQTLKAGDGAAGGLFRRAEWEADVDGDRPELQALKGTPAQKLLDGASLQPLFETRVARTRWLAERAGATIEIALDDGDVAAGARTDRICEIELELKGGAPSALLAALKDLDPDATLAIGVRAKSERGYALLRKPRRVFKAEAVPLEAGMAAGAAVQAILRSCLRQIRLNEPRLLARDVEGLHQARIGLRRLRSALTLFEAVLDDADHARLKAALREVSQRFGEARDLDVYLDRAAGPEATRNPAEPGLDAYRTALLARREAAYDAIAALLSGAFRRIMRDLMCWIEAGPWLQGHDPLRQATLARPVKALAAEVLDRRWRKVRKSGRHLDTLEPDARHRVRIAAKKLRYAAEFVAALAGEGKGRTRHAAFVGKLEALQAVLGELNDIRTGHALAFGLAQAAPEASGGASAALFAAGHVSGRQDAEMDRLLPRAAEAFDAFRDTKPFWTRWHD